MKIAYLSPTEAESIPVDMNKLKQEILKHSNTVYYGLNDFIDAFNNEEISDLGYIALKED